MDWWQTVLWGSTDIQADTMFATCLQRRRRAPQLAPTSVSTSRACPKGKLLAFLRRKLAEKVNRKCAFQRSKPPFFWSRQFRPDAQGLSLQRKAATSANWSLNAKW